MSFMEMMNLKKFVDQLSLILPYITAIFYVLWGINIIREDIETGKIRNVLLINAFKFISSILLIQITLTILGKLGYLKNYLLPQFYLYYFFHILQSILFSYILWYGEIWPAGDSKFYSINMMIIPLINPSLSGFPKFLWISAMINIFIIAAVYSIYIYIKENTVLLKKGDTDAFKDVKDYYLNEFKKLIKLKPQTIFTIFSIFSVFSYKQAINLLLQNYIFNIFQRTDIFFFLMYFLWPKLSQLLKSKVWKYLMPILYILLFIYSVSSNNPISIIKNIFFTAITNTFKFGMIFAIGKIIFERIIESYNTYYASKDEIKPGMILSSYELKILRENDVFKDIFDEVFRDGITQEQADALRKWMENHPVKNVKLKFVKAKPFAFNIFIGCIFQIVVNTNIIKWII